MLAQKDQMQITVESMPFLNLRFRSQTVVPRPATRDDDEFAKLSRKTKPIQTFAHGLTKIKKEKRT